MPLDEPIVAIVVCRREDLDGAPFELCIQNNRETYTNLLDDASKVASDLRRYIADVGLMPVAG